MESLKKNVALELAGFLFSGFFNRFSITMCVWASTATATATAIAAVLETQKINE